MIGDNPVYFSNFFFILKFYLNNIEYNFLLFSNNLNTISTIYVMLKQEYFLFVKYNN
jgi:hypothetical protein